MLKLLHGDCLELMKDIPDKSIDVAISDPPYGLPGEESFEIAKERIMVQPKSEE